MERGRQTDRRQWKLSAKKGEVQDKGTGFNESLLTRILTQGYGREAGLN